MDSISLYFHIPFCVKKCNYCSFNSFPIDKFSESIIKKYFSAIIKEIVCYENIIKTHRIKTIYFGGGTPSIVKLSYFQKIFNVLNELFDISKTEEITFEINPATVNESYLKELKKFGINRVSIGVQSFNDKILKFLGRVHNSEEAINTIKTVKKIFNNFSIDLIFAIPGQSIDILNRDISYAISFKIPHISYYGLTIEKGTKLFQQNVKEIDDELYSSMFLQIHNSLLENGYIHYEISNYSFPSYESLHNLNYWNHKNYLGFGAGAHSFYNVTRWKNFSNMKEYTSGKFIEFKEKLTEEMLQNEYIFLNLRKEEGINLSEFEKKFGFDFYEKYKEKIDKFYQMGLICVKENVLKLTPKGYLLSNEIFASF